MPDFEQKGVASKYLELIGQVQRPSRYLGREVNSIKKPWDSVEVKVALVFPDVYEVGMSHVGLRILYHVLNSLDWALAERVFSPWVDMEARLMGSGVPILSLESRRPLKEFDIIGFSLQHELLITNVLSILRLSDLKFRSKERDEKDPLVIAGGPACFNPEPFAELFDLVVIGDGEEVIVKISELVREAKSQGASKEELLEALTKVSGIYVPRFFVPRMDGPTKVVEVQPTLPSYEKVKKAVVPDLQGIGFPSRQIVPYTQLVHDRLVVEISRGCGRGCRFCQAGFIYRPLRERSVGTILGLAEMGLKETGYEELSLLSLSSGDYTCIQGLLRALMDSHGSENIALSLPSLRVDSMSPHMVEQIKRVRKTGFTIAPETGDEELRFRLNKFLYNEEVLNICGLIFEAGWKVLKLYFMVGLPYETQESIVRLRELLFQILRKVPNRAKVNVSISCFVPKSHTPFMWERMISIHECRMKLQEITKGFKGRHISFKGNPPEQSFLEGVFSRGDRLLLNVAERAFQKGARFDAWSEVFDLGLWLESFKELGIDPHTYLRKREPGEHLPWDHIDSGISKDFFLRELQKAAKGEKTGPCQVVCEGCGVCKKDVSVRLARDDPKASHELALPPGEAKVFRVKVTKLNEARFLSQLEFVRAFHRTLRRAGLRPVHSKGYHPMPKVRFMRALPVGVESLDEEVELELWDPIAPNDLKRLLNSHLPYGMKALAVRSLSRSEGFHMPKRSILVVRPSKAEGKGKWDDKWKDRLLEELELVCKRDKLVLEKASRANGYVVLEFQFSPKLMKTMLGLLGDLGLGLVLVKIKEE